MTPEEQVAREEAIRQEALNRLFGHIPAADHAIAIEAYKEAEQAAANAAYLRHVQKQLATPPPRLGFRAPVKR